MESYICVNYQLDLFWLKCQRFRFKNASCPLSAACQSSTDRKGGQAVPSLCNQCWGFCGGPTAIPDHTQNVRTSHLFSGTQGMYSVSTYGSFRRIFELYWFVNIFDLDAFSDLLFHCSITYCYYYQEKKNTDWENQKCCWDFSIYYSWPHVNKTS